MDTPPEWSVVVPLYNEEDSVRPLVQAVQVALAGHPPWELILVDDGSRDRTAEIATDAAEQDPRIRVLRLARNYGQTQAMQAGFDAARGSVVVSMDGDLQNDPADIPHLVARLDEGYDLVAGYRVRRQDHFVRRKIPSWVANRLIRAITGIPTRDNGCSLKAYRRVIVERMHLYSDMHRFLPAVAAATAGARISEVAVRHHPRRFGQSKYGLSRVLKILADLLTLKMIASFRERPLAFFGSGALGAFGLALAFLGIDVVASLRFRPEVARAFVFPSVALLFLMLACYLLMLGLVGEVAVRLSRQTRSELPPLAAERTP